jgi:leucyl-tRNA synthetase
MEELNFATIEKKWQDKWEAKKIFEVNEKSKKPKYYILEMFPYPSGEGLHMGHAWNYTIGDILARFKIMNGFNVLHPMGYDSLGLPAENAAIEAGENPKNYTDKAIAKYISQQKAIGLSYDWSRVLSSHDPSYYKWDQWIFLKMLEKNLAYQKISAVNWCSKCDTVLANEQVNDGKCWRHENTEVEIKHLKQWFLKTTAYADELYDNLDNMDWPDRTKAMQKNWIGKSHGTEIDFQINEKKWPIFTTRPDTIFGVTFMVVAAQHPRLNELVTSNQEKQVNKFLKKLKSVSEKDASDLEKEGVFTGSYAINPATNEKIPIWAANFVIADYGSGMVMADAHDQRDLEFAHKYGINLIETIIPKDEKSTDPNKSGRAFTGYGVLAKSGKFNGLKSKEAIVKITDWLIKNKKGRKVINFKLRDWGISRQRYWGTPIPIIHCEKCGAVPVPEKDLPVELPKNVKFGKGNPLETNEKWLNIKCPKCKGKSRRESETMDTFVNSSWYFLRFCDPKNNKAIFNKKKVEYWSPVDTYIGGGEHACMHLIYSRFYVKFLRDIGLLSFDEPAIKLFHQGMLHGEDGAKMSKSKGNGILPEVVSDKYGIDTARFFLSGIASPDKNIGWNEKGINGSLRFLRKVIELYNNVKIGKDSDEVLSVLNQTIQDATKQIDSFDYRATTIKLKELFDLLVEQKEISRETLESSLKMLNPFCPHITEELWEKLGNKNFISTSSWPKVDETKIKKEKGSKNLNEKIIEDIKYVLEKTEGEKIYLYVMPFELEKIDETKISKAIGKKIKIFAVDDSKKHDPENRARKAKPGKTGIYLE